jgi:ABC-type dipeptide/oligopeptide/nickel transport system permease subunit
MTALATSAVSLTQSRPETPDTLGRRLLANRRITTGGGILLVILLICLISLPRTMSGGSDYFYDLQHDNSALLHPQMHPGWMLFGTTKLGQSLLGRCLTGGVISLTIGVAAASIAVLLGVTIGLIAGYFGGWIDGTLMRIVDILYGLPYILMVILLKIALEGPLRKLSLTNETANLLVMFLAIGLVSWLTMARVIRGQVLSLRAMPFVDAARALGTPSWRIFVYHLLPNLIGPITVYATLTVPSAILQESMLSFLGIGIQPPLPTWGSLASDGLALALNPVVSCWWLLVFPCALLAITLLSLNFLGDGLRDVFDPKRRSSNV